MEKCPHRMPPYHARAGISHNITDILASDRCITVNRTFAATTLCLTLRALLHTPAHIRLKALTFRTNDLMTMIPTAINVNHSLHSTPLPFNPIH